MTLTQGTMVIPIYVQKSTCKVRRFKVTAEADGQTDRRTDTTDCITFVANAVAKTATSWTRRSRSADVQSTDDELQVDKDERCAQS